ncbi:hypothetical protein CBM2586_A10821 [Cupriavidus phytorum]|uniref:Uncharacterized protein n=1 Tax=Cupriavidus taiwanensis TaxID=164546 RepID=A0A375BB55_9BURK|nr:hypothetical protein CBM2586_A10821 [Cupriavidus taiwanensis]
MPPPCGGIVISGPRSGSFATPDPKITKLKSNRKVDALNSHVCAFRHPKSRRMTGRTTT